jgi:hypothetical protein
MRQPYVQLKGKTFFISYGYLISFQFCLKVQLAVGFSTLKLIMVRKMLQSLMIASS